MQQKKYQKLKENGWLVIRIVLGFISSYGTRQKNSTTSSFDLLMRQKRSSAAITLACLEIRSRNKEAVNSARNRIYSREVFYFLLYRRRYFSFLNWFSTC